MLGTQRNRSRGRRCCEAPVFLLNCQGKRVAPLENEASVSFSRGVAYVYQPASSAHDRRYDRAAFRREDAEGLHPVRQEPCGVHRPAPGDSDSGGFAALPPPSCPEPAWGIQCELGNDCASVLLQHHARPVRSSQAFVPRRAAPEAAHGADPGGGRTAARCRPAPSTKRR